MKNNVWRLLIMKIAIMQPYFVPYIGYFQLIKAVDKFVIYDDVDYIKRGWVNRNRIIKPGTDGKEDMWFTLPVKNASSNKLIKEIKIHAGGKEKNKMLKTIQHTYSNAPYYDDIYPLIEDIIRNSEDNLAKFLEDSLKEITNFLDLDTEFIVSSNIEKDLNLSGQEQILEICKILDAATYINLPGGKELYSKKDFKEHGVDLYFLEPKEIKYEQFGEEFIPNLSIIDVMMFNSKSEIKYSLKNYELK